MKKVILLMDIGGTHARARLVRAGDDMLKHPDIITEKTADIPGKAELMEFINEILGQQERSMTSAVLSFAGPVYEDSVVMTNWRGRDEISLADLQRLGLDEQRTTIINDMDAAALSLIAYKTGAIDMEVECLYAAGAGIKKQFNNAVLIIPGTGVGVAGVVMPGVDGNPSTPAYVSCELQHTAAPDMGEDHTGLVEAMKRRLGKRVLSWEDMVSGKGLENLYHCFLELGGESGRHEEDLNAKTIAARALDGSDKASAAALDFYYYAAGAMTQVVALTFQPFAGIYLGGETTAKNISFIRRSSYVDGLQDNAVRKGLLQSFPVYLVPEYMNLNGTLYLASRSYQ